VTKEQIQKLIKDHPNAMNLVPSSHLGDLPDLVEAHAEVFVISRSECVKNYDKDGSSWLPSAVALSRLATMAGVGFYDLGNNTRKEGPHLWVGKCQAYRMGPDGKNEDGPACEKEFDADLQIEAMNLRGKPVWNEVNGKNVKSSVPYEQKELNAQLAQFLVTGRERANTGAKTRAVSQLLGQPRAFKGIFSEKGSDSDTKEFIVSRIIWNTKNKMLMEKMLDNLAGNTTKLYGPQATAQIAAPAATPAAEPGPDEPRNVTHSADEAPGDFDDSPGFDESPAADPEATAISVELNEWAQVPEERIAWRAKKILDSGQTDLRVLKPAIEIIRYLGKGGKKGSKECATALDMSPLDPLILADLAGKVRGIQVPA